eukprot:660390-Amorphochlora_amoeboformis.AAC.1
MTRILPPGPPQGIPEFVSEVPGFRPGVPGFGPAVPALAIMRVSGGSPETTVKEEGGRFASVGRDREVKRLGGERE